MQLILTDKEVIQAIINHVGTLLVADISEMDINVSLSTTRNPVTVAATVSLVPMAGEFGTTSLSVDQTKEEQVAEVVATVEAAPIATTGAKRGPKPRTTEPPLEEQKVTTAVTQVSSDGELEVHSSGSILDEVIKAVDAEQEEEEVKDNPEPKDVAKEAPVEVKQKPSIFKSATRVVNE